MSRMMCGEACPADGFGTRSVLLGSCSARPRSGTASSGMYFFASNSFVICNSVSGDRGGTDCSGIVLATFLRVVLLSFATQALQIAMELIVHESLCRRSCAWFYCVLQLSLRRSHCHGCIKVAWRRGCVRNTSVFCSRAS